MPYSHFLYQIHSVFQILLCLLSSYEPPFHRHSNTGEIADGTDFYSAVKDICDACGANTRAKRS